MTLVVPDVGEVVMLSAVLGLADSLRLYTNNKTPASGDDASDYVEAAGAGYAAEGLVFGFWNVVPGAPSLGTYPQVIWTFTGVLGSVYGYYVVDSGGSLLWAERFGNGPYSVQNNGDQVKVSLSFSLGSLSGD